jgi:hypothetical protein
LKGRPVKRWTLRELLNGCERVCRELNEHLSTDYIPTVHDLQRVVRPHKHRNVEVADITVANGVKKIERSEAYAADLMSQLEEILDAILTHAEREVKQGV